jgi:hypothetical protein
VRCSRPSTRRAHEHWPTSAMESSLSWELPLPAHFEAVAELVTQDAIAESITCGPDAAKHLAAIRKYTQAGYDHICVHQVGKDQKGFFEFYEREILPQTAGAAPREARAAGERADPVSLHPSVDGSCLCSRGGRPLRLALTSRTSGNPPRLFFLG